MKRSLKIIIAISLLFVFIGSAYSTAFGINDLKPITQYEPFHDGISKYSSDSNREFSVRIIGKELSDDYKESYFKNNTSNTKDNVSSVGDNIYYFETAISNPESGYREMIKVETGDYVLITLSHNSKLSDGEKSAYLRDMKKFNEENNLTTEKVFLFDW